MLNNKPFIKLFKTNNKYYMYDVNKNAILNIDKSDYDLLDDCMKKDIEDYKKVEELNKFYEEGFLSSNRVKEIIHPEDESIAFHLENNLKMLTLQVTQQCNFRCKYCIYSGSYLNRTHSNKRMEFSTASKGIDFLIKNSKNNDTISIDFYGGEPLLEFDLVKQCIEYAEEKADGKNLMISMTSNGSLLTDEIVEFLDKHDVTLTISLDGPKEIHDKHRILTLNGNGSFDKVMNNIEDICTKFPQYSKSIVFNAVLDAKDDFCCTDKFFLKNETVKDKTVISTLINENYKKDNKEVSEETKKAYEDYNCKSQYELFRIFHKMIKDNNIDNCSKLVIGDYDEIEKVSKKLVSHKILPEKSHPSGPCIPGAQRLFMTVDGSFYPCEKVSETSELMKIGHIDTGFNLEKARKILNIGKVNEEACKDCWAIRMCSICGALLDTTEKDFSKDKKENCCRRIRATVEENFKDYCFLKEFGHDFERNEGLTTFNN